MIIQNSFWIIIHIFHTYPLLHSQYAAIALTTPCTSFTHLLLTKRVTFSQVLTSAPWRWFPCRPKHVGAFLFILECFNNSTFFNVAWNISGIHREVNENCSLLCYYAASGGSLLQTFRDNPSVPHSRVKNKSFLEMIPDRLSRNVSKELPPLVE